MACEDSIRQPTSHAHSEDSTSDHQDDTILRLLEIRKKNPNKLIIANLNINSIPNKFEQLKVFVQDKVDILVITESKLDSSFPISQFIISGFSKPFRLDRNRNGGGVLIFVREDIPTKELSFVFPEDIEGVLIEINLRKTKWLLCGCYRPPRQSNDYFLHHLGNALDNFSKTYSKFLLVGDFNAEESNSSMEEFLNNHGAKNIVKEKTCFKSLNNPSCVDLFITNKPRSFQNTQTINIGISDFHKMVLTVLKSSFKKCEPKVINYRDYNNFNQEVFKEELRIIMSANRIYEYKTFEEIFLMVLNKHAPLKKKTIRGNNVPYMTKTLRKAIMRRSELQTKYFKNGTIESRKTFKKQKNYCSRLYKKERKNYYEKLGVNNITDNRKFWKTIKPLLGDKSSVSTKITLVKNDRIISEDDEVANTFKDFFDTAVQSLNLTCDEDFLCDTSNLSNPIDIAIEKFKNHPSIISINNNVSPSSPFVFNNVEIENMLKEINNLDVKKQGNFGGIPAKCLMMGSEECCAYLTRVWNEEVVAKCTFSNDLKRADVTPIFKKSDSTATKNYRPVSVLPSVSKVFERLMQKQILNYIEQYLSPFLCGYRKGYSTQTALISLLEKWKYTLDNKNFAGAVLMDLSKAFDTINHELLIAKLHAYGFCQNSLQLIMDYLTNRLQHIKINTTFSSWSEIDQGVPQGSVLGPLLFNIYLIDLFYTLKEIEVCNFADDTTPYVCDENIQIVMEKLEHHSDIAISWFECNYMKLNTDKCHLLVSGHRYEHMWVRVGQDKIWEDKEVKLLGITIDNDLKFDRHVSDICLKANRKLSALIRMSKFLSLDKRRIVFKAFVESQFQYCPLVWMFHSRALNNRINRLHERALRTVYDDYESSFETLLDKDGSNVIHHKNIQRLAIEIYKMLNHEICAPGFKDLFCLRDVCNSRSFSDLIVPSVKSVQWSKLIKILRYINLELYSNRNKKDRFF